ncbi:MAG TPA: tripartite tricarboxylate transporter substrate binding protein [Pseudolabrys sp.]|nr:tripartite tricarboxylate transporter substrate binding protein [Pseudolabrys sp.]
MFARAAALLLACFSLAAPARAEYPERAIMIICASGAGGAVDVTTRVIADYLSKELGQPVVVQNEPGAGSTIAIGNVAKAARDGYTLLTVGSGVAVVSDLYPKANVDVLRDLVPVTMVGATPLVLFVAASVPAKTYPELIAWLKAHPGEATSGSNGRGSAGHLSIQLFNAMAGVDVRYIPYKTTPQAHTDLMAGRLTLMMTSSLRDASKFGIKALAVSTLERWKTMPELPTLDELGLKGYEAATWVAMMAPKGTPDAVIEKVETAYKHALADPALRKRFDDIGIIPPREVGAAYATRYVQHEISKWTEILRASPEQQ